MNSSCGQNKQRVVITGLGVISSIGIGRDEFWTNLLRGTSGISDVSSFDTSKYFTHRGGEVKRFDPKLFFSSNGFNFSRATQMGIAAARLALKDAELSQDDASRSRFAVCTGATTGSIQVIEQINEMRLKKYPIKKELIYELPTHTTPAQISREFGLKGPNFLFSTACAAGNYAIGYGFDLLRQNKADFVLGGASDAFSRISFTGFNQFSAMAPEKCQPFDKNRKGMIVAEGAGMIVLEPLESALKRKASIYAEVMGYGLSCDASHMTHGTSHGIASCMKKAILETGITAADVDFISAHGTGTMTNDRVEVSAIKEVFGSRYKSIPAHSIKSMLGHTMGAASALEAITCALVVQTDLIPPTINYETVDPDCDIDCVPNKARQHRVNIALNNSYAFGGNNASIVFKKF